MDDGELSDNVSRCLQQALQTLIHGLSACQGPLGISGIDVVESGSFCCSPRIDFTLHLALLVKEEHTSPPAVGL